jgi:hypothetical protein
VWFIQNLDSRRNQMNDNERENHGSWTALLHDLYLAVCLVAICIVVSGLMGMAYVYWGMK